MRTESGCWPIADWSDAGRFPTKPSHKQPHISQPVCGSPNSAPTPLRKAGHADRDLVEAADIYRLYFHGPAYQVIERAWWDGKQIIGLLANGLPANHRPSELPTLWHRG